MRHGTVRLGDTELTALSEADMEQVRGRSIALIPQSAAIALNPVLTIEAQLHDIAWARGVDWSTAEAELEHILASLGLTFADVRRKYPHQLSGGMQQRIVNAAAVLGTPALVIADEPTYGMDPELVDTTAAMLKQIPRRGAALLVITHDLQFARELGGRVGLMYGSYIVELREADEFFAGPLHPYGRGLLGALPENGLNEIPGHPPELTALRDECPFAPRCTHVQDACRAAVPTMQSLRNIPVAVTVVPKVRYATGAMATLTNKMVRMRCSVKWCGVCSMLEVRNVSKSYRHGRSTLQVLSDVSLAIAAGERVGLVGASGAGKSTLAQIMALLMRPDAGTVSVDGRVIQGAGLRVPPDVRRNVQLIWQSPRMSSDPRFTLRQILSEPLESLKGPERAQAAKRLPDLLDRVGLTGELLDRQPHAVSDGQLQRACLIRALVLEPKYLICDEFTAMLDASTQAALLNTLGDEQARTGMGIVLITHDHSLARHWCHRIIQARMAVSSRQSHLWQGHLHRLIPPATKPKLIRPSSNEPA